jgi:hypothetical protein
MARTFRAVRKLDVIALGALKGLFSGSNNTEFFLFFYFHLTQKRSDSFYDPLTTLMT